MKNKISLLILFCLLFSLITTPVHAQVSDDYPVYIVQSGDTLGQIAVLFNVTPTELVQLNGINDPNNIYPGLTLKIPGYPGIHGVLKPIVMGLGESWQNVLVKYQADKNSLIQINNLINISLLNAGKNLIVPVSTDFKEYEPKAMIDDDSSILEKAVILNSTPESLLIQNRKSSDLFFFTRDLVFDNNSDQETINPFSDSIVSLDINPLPLIQGDTIVVHVKTKQPMTLEGQLNGHKLNFYSSDNIDYYALQGINAMADVGLTDFSISGSQDSKQVFSFQQNVMLNSGNFATDPNLTVDPSMIDPAVTEPELQKVEAITAPFSPIKYWEGTFIGPDSDYQQGMDTPYVRDITSPFGNRRTYNNDPTVTFHTGVDFGGGINLPIVAPAAGKVVFAGPLDVRGNATFIDHGLGVYSAYFHQSEIDVKVGDMVQKGQKIGVVGNTGRVDRADEYVGAGAHLHWEIWVNGIQVNPLDWLNSEYP
jgi:murein DD-endopeptidase MepM/ murein hydrolase activator NlpD